MYRAYFDGLAKPNPGPASIGAYIETIDGNVIWEVSKKIGDATNNIAEYKALIEVLQELHDRNITDAEIYGDSQLVVNQVNENWSVNQRHLEVYQLAASCLLSMTKSKLRWISRKLNKKADALSQKAFQQA